MAHCTTHAPHAPLICYVMAIPASARVCLYMRACACDTRMPHFSCGGRTGGLSGRQARGRVVVVAVAVVAVVAVVVVVVGVALCARA